MEIINKQKLISLYGSEETSLDIIHMFIDQSAQLLEDLDNAIQLKDIEVLRKICHKGIGQSRYIAAEPVEIILSKLPKEDLKAQNKLMEELKQQVLEISNAYK